MNCSSFYYSSLSFNAVANLFSFSHSRCFQFLIWDLNHCCCKIRFTVYKKLILIYIIFNLGKINSRVKKTILKLKFLVLFLNEMIRSCRKRIEVANSESKERIEFLVRLWGGRQQNNFSFWNDRYPFQLYLWMSFLSDFFSLMLLVRWIVLQFAKWLCWLWKLFVLPPKARGKKKHSPILISVG